jgi:hypothetical protein
MPEREMVGFRNERSAPLSTRFFAQKPAIVSKAHRSEAFTAIPRGTASRSKARFFCLPEDFFGPQVL